MLVKGDERLAALGLCEMEGIGEFHSPRHPIQCLSCLGGFSRVTRGSPCKSAQSGNDLNLMTSSQRPPGFEQNGRAEEDVLAIDQRARLRELLRVVPG